MEQPNADSHDCEPQKIEIDWYDHLVPAGSPILIVGRGNILTPQDMTLKEVLVWAKSQKLEGGSS